jgi:histidyl-tRNA synthetase
VSKKSISGFPELLPAGRAVESMVEDRLRHTFELHGFAGIQTRSVEPLTALEAKGETSKEVYVLQRLQSARSGGPIPLRSDTLGLHFDLTVPLARYVLANSNDLTFPFKRYQIQKVWRGERPQEGRFREFTQADIDIVGSGDLGLHHEVEAGEVMLDAFAGLDIGPVLMEINNRKLLQGIATSAGIEDFEGTLRGLDKYDKIGPRGVSEELRALGLSDSQIDVALNAAAISVETGRQLREAVGALGLDPTPLAEGLDELATVLDALQEYAPGQVRASLRIARGLDYYTGTVYETVIPGHESFGSVCSGGRYDALVSDGRRTFPGVGLSIGVSRLVALLLTTGILEPGAPSPARVLVSVTSEETRGQSVAVARALRQRNIATEVSPSARKFGQQIRFAERRGISYVWFVDEDGGHSVKNIVTGDQEPADPAQWLPADVQVVE